MKSLHCFVVSFTTLTPSVALAEVVNLTTHSVPAWWRIRRFCWVGLGQYGRLQSIFRGYTAALDTVADTGSFTDFDTDVAQIGGDTRTSSVATVFPPTSFPEVPMVIVQGPTQSTTVPLNVVYSHIGSATVNRTLPTEIEVGNNFPDSTKVTTFFEMTTSYEPSIRTVFNGTIDGRSFNIQMLPVRIAAERPIPKPTGICLSAIGAAGFGCAVGRRLRRPGASIITNCRATRSSR